MIKVFLPNNLVFIPKSNSFESSTNFETLRFLKGIYPNKNNFKNIFLLKLKEPVVLNKVYNFFLDEYDNVEPFSYKEAFEIESNIFKALVFGSINITDMINNLGTKRISVEGIQVKRKQFDKNGIFLGFKEYDNIYETHEVNGKKLGVRENQKLYVVKCWCTSTNKEHWLWIEEKFKDSPKEAIASTFRIHENLIPYIKELKRQGDILLVELTQDIEPSGNIIPLTSEQYFSLLTCES